MNRQHRAFDIPVLFQLSKPYSGTNSTYTSQNHKSDSEAIYSITCEVSLQGKHKEANQLDFLAP